MPPKEKQTAKKMRKWTLEEKELEGPDGDL